VTAIRRLLAHLASVLFPRAIPAHGAGSIPRVNGVRLDGETPDGRAIHIDLSFASLCEGVTLGLETDDPDRVIAGKHVRVRQATLQLRGDALYVCDEGSVHGTSLNARDLQPRRHAVVVHGDWLRLGGTVLRLTFH